MIKTLFIFFTVISFSCTAQQSNKDNPTIDENKDKITLTEEEWKQKLTEKEFYVLRKSGTERAFTGEYNKHYKEGTYTCAGCSNPLFSSTTKYNSGSGWPSFYATINESNVKEIKDNSHGMTRVEVRCAKCDGHLGHVFEDGPRDKTGLRYCINSVSLDFKEKKK